MLPTQLFFAFQSYYSGGYNQSRTTIAEIFRLYGEFSTKMKISVFSENGEKIGWVEQWVVLWTANREVRGSNFETEMNF